MKNGFMKCDFCEKCDFKNVNFLNYVIDPDWQRIFLFSFLAKVCQRFRDYSLKLLRLIKRLCGHLFAIIKEKRPQIKANDQSC